MKNFINYLKAVEEMNLEMAFQLFTIPVVMRAFNKGRVSFDANTEVVFFVQ